MAIQKQNVKLMASERLTDYEDGGGMMSPQEIIDGEVNNLFADISRLDRVYGRVSLRKAFLSVQTAAAEMFYGSHAIITDPPNDDTVTVTMFSTESYPDERANAQNRLESYLAVSVESRYRLFGNHLAGQRAILVFGEVGMPDPAIGGTFVMRLMTSATNGTLVSEQYVRIQTIVSRETRTFTQPGGSQQFQRDVLTLEISAPLEIDFAGSDPDLYANSPSRTKFHETTVADAANYFGVAKVAQNVAAGALTIKVPSLFSQLVPSAQTETPSIDNSGAADGLVVVASGAADAMTAVVPSVSSSTNPQIFFMPRAIVPGTFHMTGSGTGSTYDDGAGNITTGSYTATINYVTGQVTIVNNGGANYTPGPTMVAKPGAPTTQAGISGAFPVTVENRAYNYVLSLKPLPAPGSFFVDYMTQGKWYRLRDNGAGQIEGDDATHGSGTINYASGSVIVTTGALPDVNTSILYGWGTGEAYTLEAPTPQRRIKFSLGVNITPASLVLTVPLPTGSVTVTSNAAGVLSGTNASGTVNFATGEVDLRLTTLPNGDASITADYDIEATESWAGNFTASQTLSPAPIKPGSVTVTYTMDAPAVAWGGGVVAANANGAGLALRDNGAGILLDQNGTQRGTIAYSTGAIAVSGTYSKTENVPRMFPGNVFFARAI